MVLFRLFTRKWIISTILVILGIAVLMRLGIWQLDRLEQRREFNARVSEQLRRPPLDLSAAVVDEDLMNIEYRKVTVTGMYDFENQVVLRNQSWQDQYGVHLITPLHISGSNQVVIVDRGWIPATDMAPENWSKYNEPGEVNVIGTIRRSQVKPDFGRISDPIIDSGERLTAWNLLNIEQMQTQMPYRLIPIYISLVPDNSHLGPPYKSELKLDLTEGPHLAYAIQWFTFATILGLIYYLYVRREEKIKSMDKSGDVERLQSRSERSILGDQNASSHRGGKL
jgi:surfeit locus 1 family protein